MISKIFEKLGLFVAKRTPGYTYYPANERLQMYKTSFDHSNTEFSRIATIVKNDNRTLLSESKLFVIWQAIKNTRAIEGSALEFGAFRGGSAYFIAAAMNYFGKKYQKITVVDTFEGHPDCISQKNDRTDIHHIGKFSGTSFDDVKHYLSVFKNVQILKADCIDYLTSIEMEKISFIHLDLDLYEPTRMSLFALDSKLMTGGVFVIDDFLANTCPGVERAVFEFIEEHPIYETWFFHTRQIALIKR